MEGHPDAGQDLRRSTNELRAGRSARRAREAARRARRVIPARPHTAPSTRANRAMQNPANRLQTYTRRTQRRSTVYAAWRKSFYTNMGLGRVELPTSRLSGPLGGRSLTSADVGFPAAPAAR